MTCPNANHATNYKHAVEIIEYVGSFRTECECGICGPYSATEASAESSWTALYAKVDAERGQPKQCHFHSKSSSIISTFESISEAGREVIGTAFSARVSLNLARFGYHVFNNGDRIWLDGIVPPEHGEHRLYKGLDELRKRVEKLESVVK